MSNRIAGAFNRSGDTRAVALDISNTFDRVWYAGLLHKLKSYGISGHVFCLLLLFSVMDGFEWLALSGSGWEVFTRISGKCWSFFPPLDVTLSAIFYLRAAKIYFFNLFNFCKRKINNFTFTCYFTFLN